MTKYIALLRGVNVGGKAKLPMAELKDALLKDGFQNVRTYIQSGNVLFESESKDTAKLAAQVSKVIQSKFDLSVTTVVFSDKEWQTIVSSAPSWWGKDTEWKHNLLILIPPYDMKKVVASIGELKPDIEAIEPGEGVLYQSMSFKLFGRTTTGKLASSPVYKQMTVRNFNTSVKLGELLKAK